jgi:hypothetical protein
MGRFGRKTGGEGKLFTILFCIFRVFQDFFIGKPLRIKKKRRAGPSKKNHTRKPTVGFCRFLDCGTIME